MASVMLTALFLYVFWLLYLAIMSLYRAYKNGTLSLVSKVLGYPILAIGLVFDVLANITIFSLVFLELPKEWLVTDRLKKHIKTASWRGKLAGFICHHLLSPFDPTGDHCD